MRRPVNGGVDFGRPRARAYRIALLTNLILPYRIPVLQELERKCKSLKVFISNPTEGGGQGWNGVSVQIQKSLTWHSIWHHPQNFSERLSIQFPYDTIARLANFNPDVVISGELGLRTIQAALFTGSSLRRKLIVWATLSEATEQGRGLIRPIVRRALLTRADAVLVNGESGARYIQRFGVEPAKVFRVPQTTDVAPFLNRASDRRLSIRHRLLYVGRLIELKGLIPFLRRLAAWALKNPERKVEFSLAGDGPMRSAIAEFVCPRNVSLTMLGNVPYDRLPEVYGNAGILVFPTLADEWGLVVVEAMAAGLPVLGSIYSQAVEDLITAGVTGWTFRPDHVNEMDAALNQALGTEGSVLDAMGAKAHERARSMTPARMADQIWDAVKFTCGPRGTTAVRGTTAG